MPPENREVLTHLPDTRPTRRSPKRQGGAFDRVRDIEARIRDFPQILECHTVSGDHDYLLKVVARDLKDLSQFLADRLMQVPGVDDVRSMICLEEVKALAPLPTGP